ncbi:unnamed protein product [Trifolium pratense]|uniref:Uncharacterized protein n=1 Tax=Trifolium pratense TaxID=57577 RepID=A0ACB0J5Y5_TRIPR|nr:unnamed protein product [Trifolium pratense]
MASFLTDLAKPYVEKSINGAVAESSYICCFMCHVKDFEEEKAMLEVESKTVKQRVEVATRRGEDVMLFFGKKLKSSSKKTPEQNKKVFVDFVLIAYGNIEGERNWQIRRSKLKN